MVKAKNKSPVVLVREHDRFGKVRVVYLDGSVWFVGKDVAAAIGYKNGNRDIKRHVDPEDILEYRIGISGQTRKVLLINKSGVYSLILDSQLPEAKEYRHWITSEVLPSVDETGSYTAKRDNELERAEREWQHARRNGIDGGRNPLTRAIQRFNLRDFPLGDKDPSAKKRYSYLTWQLQTKKLRIPKGKRDDTNTDGLEILHVAEMSATKILNDVYGDDGSFQLAAAQAISWAEEIAKMTGRDKLPLPPRTSKRKLPCIPLLN